MRKYAVLNVYQDFKNVNMIKRIWMAIDACQNFKIKKSAKRSKRKHLLKCKQNVKNMHR